MFRLTVSERDEVITICDNLTALRFSPVLPNAFTQDGVAMLSGVLRSSRAVRSIRSLTEPVHAPRPAIGFRSAV